MSEKSDRAAVLAHAALAKRAIAMIRKHGETVCVGYNSPNDLSPDDEDAVCVTFDGDVGTLHYTGGYGDSYAASFEFNARCLWSARAIREAKAELERQAEIEAARQLAAAEARERAQYEALRRKFDPTGDLRADIRMAMALHARIDREDAETIP